MESTTESIARGYAVAALFTAGIDGGPGEYVPDETKVAAILPQAREAASAFVHIVGRGLIDASGLEPETVGHCLHYDREGHGTGFRDESAGSDYARDRMEAVARFMGPNDELTV